jgi:energy-coupling factor transport system ATP-binding protein
MDLTFENLVFWYAGTQTLPAIDKASACLPSNSSIAIVGPNGAGKSTLCKNLNGVLKPTNGIIRIGENTVLPHKHPGRYVAYAFQNPDDQLFLPLVMDELAFGPRNLGMEKPQIEEVVRWASRLFHLGEVEKKHPLDLPFALRKRISMAAAVAMQRPWVIWDEPTLGQDPIYCDELLRIKDCLKERGTSLIVISHDPEFIFEICDYFVVMVAGRCEWSGSRERLLNDSPSWILNFLNIPSRLSKDLRLPSNFSTQSSLVKHFGLRYNVEDCM